MNKIEWENYQDGDSTPLNAENLNLMQDNIEEALAGMLDYFYPVGTIYETTAANLDTTTKMATHFGGTWEVYGAGRVLVASNTGDTEFDTIGETGGAKTHTLTVDEMPWHSHVFATRYNAEAGAYNVAGVNNTGVQTPGAITTSGIGGGQAHNNLQPYIVVYRYRRTA